MPPRFRSPMSLRCGAGRNAAAMPAVARRGAADAADMLKPVAPHRRPRRADRLQRAGRIGAFRPSAAAHHAAAGERQAAHHRRHRLVVDRRRRREFARRDLSEPACRRAEGALSRPRHHGAQSRRQRRRDRRHDGAVCHRRDRRAPAARAVAGRHQFGAARSSARRRMRWSCTKASRNSRPPMPTWC